MRLRVVLVALGVAVAAMAPARQAQGAQSVRASVRASTTPAAFPTQVHFNVGGNYQPFGGDFDGNHYGDVFWYAPGRAQDYVWYFTDLTHYVSRPVTVNGSYRPVVGDFDGNGYDDILWYSPSAASQPMWIGTVHRTFEVARPITVRGAYEPIAGDFDGDGHSDVLWYAPGGAQDYVWYGHGDLRFTTKALRIDGTYEPAAAPFASQAQDDVLLYGPGAQPDEILAGDGHRNLVAHSIDQPGVYTPLVGEFGGGIGSGEIVWYAPGAPLDQAWYSTARPFAFDEHTSSIAGEHYRPFVKPGNFGSEIFWYNPGPGPDTLWLNVRESFAATTGPRHRFSAGPASTVYSLASTASGDLVVGGFAATRGGDAMVEELDATGRVRWRRTFGSTTYDQGSSVAVDGAGNVYFSGYTQGRINGAPETTPGLFVAKLTPTGHVLWIHQHSGFRSDTALVLDTGGDVDVGGFSGSALGLVQYDTNGHERWIVVDTGVQLSCAAPALAAAPDGDIVAAGMTADQTAGVVARYASTGHLRWRSGPVGRGQHARMCGLAVDGADNIYAVGGALSRVPVQPSEDAFVVALDPSGHRRWSQQLAEHFDDYARSAAVDSTGALVVAGHAEQALPASIGDGGLFVARYRTDGQLTSLHQYCGSGCLPFESVNDRPDGFAIDALANVFIGLGGQIIAP